MSAKRRLQWTRALGVALVAWALVVALDPDYPVRRVAMPGREDPRVEAVAPRGDLAGADAFRWSWNGAPRRWRVEVRDADLAVVRRSGLVGGDEWPIPPALRRRLEGGGWFLWQVTSAGEHGPRSAPVWFALGVRRRAADAVGDTAEAPTDR